jgi:ribonuclease R
MNNYNIDGTLKSAQGTISVHPHGFGFFSSSNGNDQVFIPKHLTQDLLPDDIVLVKWYDEGAPKPSAEAVRVIKRKSRSFAFVWRKNEKGYGSWTPFTKWHARVSVKKSFSLPNHDSQSLNNGDIWIANFDGSILSGSIQLEPDHFIGNIHTLLGIHNAYVVDACHPHDDFNNINSTVVDSIGDRVDWTDTPFVTVDGASTKDFDDAVFVEKHNNGWTMKVAIADVSAFVPEGSLLDLSAKARGTSVYLPMNVRPMFPHVLSDDKCSLLAGVPRAALGVTIEFDINGSVIGSPKFCHATINVARRCLFSEVEEWLENEILPQNTNDSVLNAFKAWKSWSEAFVAAEDAPFPWRNSEHYIFIDQALNVSCSTPKATPRASRLVELAMVSANRAAAQFIMSAHGGGVFRNHAEPQWNLSEDALLDEGWTLDTPSPGEEKKWWKTKFEETAGTPNAWILAGAWTKIQKRASYNSINTGHHALSASSYTHFTSPIRRYADLIVHRAIHSGLMNQKIEPAKLVKTIESCNVANLRAKKLESDVRDHWMAIWWNSQNKSKVYDGTVKAIKKNGEVIVQADIFSAKGTLLRWADSDDVFSVGQRVSFRLFKAEKTSLTFKIFNNTNKTAS